MAEGMSLTGSSRFKGHYHALVDMGRFSNRELSYLGHKELTIPSNGIRFSISDLSAPRARILPTVYQNRCDISLYDAQHEGLERVPIPQVVIEDVLGALLQFKETCQDFGVLQDRIRIVATEATRTAINCEDFLHQVSSSLGFEVEMLTKEEEGRIGALGIASSFDHVNGLVMDLGGGSVQLTWMETDNGSVNTGKQGSISLPYGAAALKKELESIESQEQHEQLHRNLVSDIRQAFQDIGLSVLLERLSESQQPYHIFLSGGGFRGWGYILMSKHTIQPYPIPIINGFSIDSHDFQPSNINDLSKVDNSTFRISSRRSSQIPAIELLVTALTSALPSSLKHYKVHFAQGGVREGLLFSTLPPSVQATNPLVAATSPYAPQDTSALLELVHGAFPLNSTLAPSISPFKESLVLSAVHLLHVHATHPKDIRASSALRCTTTGILADTHGISHEERALLALALCERWRSELPPTDHGIQDGLQRLVGAEATFWTAYLGRILHGLGDLFPAGVVREGVLQVRSQWGLSEGGKKPRKPVLQVEIECIGSKIKIVEDWVKDIEKLGKKKNWVRSAGSERSVGFKIQCTVSKMSTAV